LVNADCRFIGFGGSDPPLLISLESFGTFRNCTFEDLQLTVEVIDISFGGLLRLEDCTFHNISLRNKKLVSTTENDLVRCGRPFDEDFLYLPDDDAAYDVEMEPIDVANPSAGMRVRNATLSDCLRPSYLCASLSCMTFTGHNLEAVATTG
jgi:hypothetical protein